MATKTWTAIQAMGDGCATLPVSCSLGIMSKLASLATCQEEITETLSSNP